MFSLNDTLKKSGLVGRWETKQFIWMALVSVEKQCMMGNSSFFTSFHLHADCRF